MRRRDPAADALEALVDALHGRARPDARPVDPATGRLLRELDAAADAISPREGFVEALEARLLTGAAAAAPAVFWTDRRPVRARRWLATAAAVGVAVLGLAAGVLASPRARAEVDYLGQQLASLVSISGMAGGRLTGLHPAPGFTVLQPTYLPEGMLRVVDAYNPGPRPGSPDGPARPAPSGISEVARRVAGVDIEPAVAETAARRGGQLMGASQEPTLVLVYGAPPDRFVEIVQRPAGGKALPAGDPVVVRGAPATLRRADGRDVFAWVEGDTVVELHTTLERSEAQRVIDGLQPTPLETFVPPPAQAGSDQSARMRALRDVFPDGMPRPTPPLLAPRVVRAEKPAVDRAAVAERCGVWDPTTPMRASRHAGCAAQLVSGASWDGGGGLNLAPWRWAAAELGLDPSVGPAPEQEVWVATFLGRPGEGGAVVVIDAATGEPYLVVRLRPAAPAPGERGR